MRQIEKNAFGGWGCFEYRPEKMAASSADITDQFESREITTFNNCGDLSPRFGQHRCVKNAVCLGMPFEVTPDSFRQSFFHRSASGFNRILQLAICVPIDRQSKHPHKATHRLWMIGSQHPRSGRMFVGIALLFKYAVGGSEAQNPRERIFVRADRSCKLS